MDNGHNINIFLYLSKKERDDLKFNNILPITVNNIYI